MFRTARAWNAHSRSWPAKNAALGISMKIPKACDAFWLHRIAFQVNMHAFEFRDDRKQRRGGRWSQESESRMEPFSATTVTKEKTVQVVLQPSFCDANWDALELFVKSQMGKGLIYFDLDLRRLTFLNSMMLGLIVGLNGMLGAEGGHARLIVDEDSMINQLLTISKLRRVLTVITV
jgi:anti-anti-sigma regulatory factor